MAVSTGTFKRAVRRNVLLYSKCVLRGLPERREFRVIEISTLLLYHHRQGANLMAGVVFGQLRGPVLVEGKE